jgi:hypothetical protein
LVSLLFAKDKPWDRRLGRLGRRRLALRLLKGAAEDEVVRPQDRQRRKLPQATI